MNKNLYRHVFSKKFGMLVAVAENVVSDGKSASGESAGSAAATNTYGAAASFNGMAFGALSFAVAMAVVGAGAGVRVDSFDVAELEMTVVIVEARGPHPGPTPVETLAGLAGVLQRLERHF